VLSKPVAAAALSSGSEPIMLADDEVEVVRFRRW
jgi:hypothetical protein